MQLGAALSLLLQLHEALFLQASLSVLLLASLSSLLTPSLLSAELDLALARLGEPVLPV